MLLGCGGTNDPLSTSKLSCCAMCAIPPGIVATCHASCPSAIDFACGFHVSLASGTRSRIRLVMTASSRNSCSIAVSISPPYSLRILRYNPNLKNPGPQFSRHKQSPAFPVIRDAVQNCFRLALIERTQQSRKVDPPQNLSRPRRDPRNPIAMPDVGENFSLNKLQFIEFIDRLSLVAYFDPPLLTERIRIQNANFRATVTHEKVVAICC